MTATRGLAGAAGEEVARSGASADEMANLIERVAAHGDRDAFESVFRYYMPRLKAWGVYSGVSAAVSEELAQEAMISLWRKAATFQRSRASAACWVYAIFRNKMIDHFRRHPVREAGLDLAADLCDHAPDPEAAAHRGSAGRELQRAIAALPVDQAMVLRAVYFGNRSHREVAQALDLPLGTVKSRIRLALARIRLAVDTQGRF